MNPGILAFVLETWSGCIQAGWGSDLWPSAVVLWNSASHVSTMLRSNLDLPIIRSLIFYNSVHRIANISTIHTVSHISLLLSRAPSVWDQTQLLSCWHPGIMWVKERDSKSGISRREIRGILWGKLIIRGGEGIWGTRCLSRSTSHWEPLLAL